VSQSTDGIRRRRGKEKGCEAKVKSKHRNTATDVHSPRSPAMKSLNSLFLFIVLAIVLGHRLPPSVSFHRSSGASVSLQCCASPSLPLTLLVLVQRRLGVFFTICYIPGNCSAFSVYRGSDIPWDHLCT
jgi:hypothetical protein